MCIILFSYRNHPKYKLVLAANRDEFYKRPSAQADFWSDNPNILAGRDLKENGTWLGITKEGRFASLTNFRGPSSVVDNAQSRGQLVSDYLNSNISPKEYLSIVKNSSYLYSGFNLLVGDLSSLFYYSKFNNEIIEIKSGIHGLSNHSLNTPWPKVVLGTDLLKEVLNEKFSPHKLFNILEDKTTPEDKFLPDTKIGIDLERLLSPIFIKSTNYGTRAMTVITIDYNNEITFIEKSLDSETQNWNECFYCFKV